MRGHCSAGPSPRGEHFPRIPQQEQGRALLHKAVESSVPIEQMETLRSLLGRVPAHPESYLRQFLGQVDCQLQTNPHLLQVGMDAAL